MPLPRWGEVDLRGLSFMDSSGLAVILGAHERALSEGRPPVRIAIRGSNAVESLFRTIGAGEYQHLIDGPDDLQAATQPALSSVAATRSDGATRKPIGRGGVTPRARRVDEP